MDIGSTSFAVSLLFPAYILLYLIVIMLSFEFHWEQPICCTLHRAFNPLHECTNTKIDDISLQIDDCVYRVLHNIKELNYKAWDIFSLSNAGCSFFFFLSCITCRCIRRADKIVIKNFAMSQKELLKLNTKFKDQAINSSILKTFLCFIKLFYLNVKE